MNTISPSFSQDSEPPSRQVSDAMLLTLATLGRKSGLDQHADTTGKSGEDSERRFRELLDALPAAIYTTDAEGRITHLNPAAVELSGRTPEFGTDRWCLSWKLYYPDGTPMPHDQCPMAISLKDGRAVRGEKAIMERPDGTRIWFTPYPTPWLDAEGRVVGGINMLVDITERIEHEEKLRAREDQLTSEAGALGELNELSSRLWRAPTLRAGLDEMLAATIKLLGADFGNVQLLDAARRVLRIEVQRGFEQPFLDFFREVSADDESACGRALRLNGRIIIEDVELDPSFEPMRPIARAAGFRAVQSAPLIGRDGAPLGMLSTHWRHPHCPDAQSLRRLDLYVRQAVDFIERKGIEEVLRQKQQQLSDELHAIERLQQVSIHLPRADDGQLYEHIMDAAVAIMRSDFASMHIHDAERGAAGELRLLAFRGVESESAQFWKSVRADSGCTCGEAFRTKRRSIATDVETCDFVAGTSDRDAYLRAGMRSAQSTPLISRGGELLGMLSTHWKQPHEPTQRDLRLLDVLARQAADWIERKRSENVLRESEARFRAFTTATSDVVYCMSADWSEMRQLQWREFIPDTLTPSRTWLDKYIHPDDQPLVHEAIQRAIETKSDFELEHRVIRVDGRLGWVHSRATPILADGGAVVEWIGAASDVTQRKLSEEALRFRETMMAGQSKALEMAINDAPLEESLAVLVRAVTEGVGHDARAGFYLANADKTALRHVVGMDPDYAKAVDGFTIGPDSLACGLATHTGKPVLTSDVRNDPLWQPWLWMAEKFDYRACWSFPIHSAKESLIGTLAIYSRQPREATARDVDICSLVTHTASLIISRHTEAAKRKQMELALRNSEARNRQTLALMPVAVYSCDADGVITFFNQQAAQLWGRAPKVGDTDERFCGSEQLILPDGTPLPHAKCPMAIALSQDKSFRNAEVNIRRPDGSLVEVSVNVDPIRNERNEVIGAINAFHDISAIKRAEHALRESERRLAAELASMTRLHELSLRLVRQSDLGSVMQETMRATGELLASAHCTAQLIETQPNGEASLRLVASAGFDPEFVDGFRIVDCKGLSTCAAALARREPVIVEDLASSPEFAKFASLVFPLGIRAAMSIPLTTTNGASLGVFTVYWTETHRPNEHAMRVLDLYLQQVARQIERRAAEVAIGESEERFRMVADNMAQLAWTCDTLGNVTWYNKRWLEYTGLAFEEMKGWDWSKVQHPDHVDRVVSTVRRSAETGEPWEETFPLRAADGRYRWFLSRAVPIHDERGEIVRWFGTNTDITEQREAEEALRDADRRKDEFLATLAHELRNPLAPIRNSLHILRLAGNDAGATEHVREMMDRQVTHMVRLVDDLMEVSRITRDKIELRKERIDLAAVVKSAVETSKPLIEGAGHRLSISLAPEPVILEADPVRLAQILTNLLNNAAKYTEQSGQIWLCVERDASEAVISVRDTGIGIPANSLTKIFELFAQVDRTYSRAQGGLGIGLTLARRLVSLHGGSIEANSDGPGRGSEFVVRLPLATGQVNARDGHDPVNQTPAAAARRVLIVDDNLDAAESLSTLLRFLGAEVRTANDGQAALEALKTFQPSAILLDIGLPGMDGFEVARRARHLPEGQSVLLIALTGWGQQQDRLRSKEAGIDHHLVKPVDLSALQALLETIPQRPAHAC